MHGGEAEETGGRERLLAAAVSLFAAKGYAATTVRDIVRAAGVSPPVLYYHFGNKEGLFLALVHQGIAKLEAALGRALEAGGSAGERLRQLCRAHSAIRRELAGLAWVVEQILFGPPEAAPPIDLRALARERVRLLEEIVTGGLESGELRPCSPTHVALALTGAIDVAARSQPFDLGGGSPEEQLEGMLEVILAGLEAPGRHPCRLPC